MIGRPTVASPCQPGSREPLAAASVCTDRRPGDDRRAKVFERARFGEDSTTDRGWPKNYFRKSAEYFSCPIHQQTACMPVALASRNRSPSTAPTAPEARESIRRHLRAASPPSEGVVQKSANPTEHVFSLWARYTQKSDIFETISISHELQTVSICGRLRLNTRRETSPETSWNVPRERN